MRTRDGMSSRADRRVGAQSVARARPPTCGVLACAPEVAKLLQILLQAVKEGHRRRRTRDRRRG